MVSSLSSALPLVSALPRRRFTKISWGAWNSRMKSISRKVFSSSLACSIPLGKPSIRNFLKGLMEDWLKVTLYPLFSEIAFMRTSMTSPVPTISPFEVIAFTFFPISESLRKSNHKISTNTLWSQHGKDRLLKCVWTCNHGRACHIVFLCHFLGHLW